MVGKIFKKALTKCLAICASVISVVALSPAGAQTPSGEIAISQSKTAVARFKVDISEIDRSFADNAAGLDSLVSWINTLSNSETAKISKISVLAAASPEGSYSRNIGLAKNRARVVSEYIANHTSVELSNIQQKPVGPDFDGLRRMLDEVSFEYKNEVISILDNTPLFIYKDGKIVDGKQKQLMDLRGGRPWFWMQANLYPKLRRTEVVIDYTEYFEEHSQVDTADSIYLPEPSDTIVAEPETAVQEVVTKPIAEPTEVVVPAVSDDIAIDLVEVSAPKSDENQDVKAYRAIVRPAHKAKNPDYVKKGGEESVVKASVTEAVKDRLKESLSSDTSSDATSATATPRSAADTAAMHASATQTPLDDTTIEVSDGIEVPSSDSEDNQKVKVYRVLVKKALKPEKETVVVPVLTDSIAVEIEPLDSNLATLQVAIDSLDIALLEEPSTKVLDAKLAVGANALYTLLMTPTINVELPVSEHISVGLNYTFPWFVWGDNTRAYEILHLDLFARYYLRPEQPLTGWFLGLSAGGAYYDLQPNGNGYQGEASIISLEAGYTKALSERWRMTLSVGAGWMGTAYRRYEAMNSTYTHLVEKYSAYYYYVGPTRLNVGFSYVFGSKTVRGGGNHK